MKIKLLLLLVFIGIFLSGCLPSKLAVNKKSFTNFPVHYLGLLPGVNCKMQYHLDILSNNAYFLRTACFQNGAIGKSSDSIGRWYIDKKTRIVLNNGTDSPQYFRFVGSNAIELMDTQGEKIESELDYTLMASNTAKTIKPQLLMHGMYSYMADASIFQECITGMNFNVAFKEDSLWLERAYMQAKKVQAQKLKVYIEGRLLLDKGEDNKVNVPTLIVEKFIKILPKERCQNLYSKAKLTNTYWKLTVINGKAVQKTYNKRREAHMVLSQGRVKGSTGCNGMGGAYVLDGNKLSFSDKGMAMTRMFCKGSVENQFLKAMREMQSYKIKGEYLEIFDKNGAKLARFESVYLY